MSEGVTIYLLLWLLYLSECFIWVSKRSVAFVSPWKKQWRVRVPSSFLATSTGGAVLLNPLFPATRVVVGSILPVSISPDGICAFNAQSSFDTGRPWQTPHHFVFEDIKCCSREDRLILVNKAPFVECANLAESQQIEALINQATRTPASQRQRLIRQFLAARFAHRDALGALAKALPRLRSLEILCSLVFPLLFILAPMMALHYGLEEIIIPTASLMIGFAVVIAWLFWYQHKTLWPSFSGERFSTLAKIIFCPPGALRAVGHLTANLLSACDIIVIASLLPHDERKRFISAYLRDLHFPLKDGLEGPAKEVADWYRAEVLNEVTEYMKTQSDVRPESILAPPVLETGCYSYCPRCQSQFTMRKGECSDCDGVRLLSSSTVTP